MIKNNISIMFFGAIGSQSNSRQNTKDMNNWELFTDPNSFSSKYFNQPTGIWLTPETYSLDYVKNILSTSESKVPVFVLYFHPAKNYNHIYQKKIRNYFQVNRLIADNIAKQRTIIIVEPDLLSLGTYDKSSQRLDERIIKKIVSIYKNRAPNCRLYINAGHSNWHPAKKVAKLLKKAGIHHADGFATNVSNFQTTKNEIQYAKKISNLLNGKHFVIDTSRNGCGPGKSREGHPRWCDPKGVCIGRPPTTDTKIKGLDAYLWIKAPGEADGCAYPAGTFHPGLINY